MLEDRDYMREESRGGGLAGFAAWQPVRVLLVANIAVFVIQQFLIPRGTPPFWISTDLPAGGLSWDSLAAGRVWTLVTYMFVHSGFESGGLAFLHILGNLLIIFVAGRPLQGVLTRWQFYLIYFLGGIAGALLELAVNRDTYLIGASAGALALLLALAASDPERRIVLLVPLPVELRLRTVGRAALIISAVLGVVTSLMGASEGQGTRMVQEVTGVAHFAHLGGGIVGLLVMRRIGFRDGRVTRGDILRGRDRRPPWGRGRRRGAAGRGARGREDPPVERERPRDEVEYDAVLDKVNRKGLHSLSERERAVLEEAAERIRARDKRA